MRIPVFVGTYTCPIVFGTGQILDGKGEGIYLLELDLETGNLEHIRTVTGVTNPSYLVFNKKNRCLYVVNELKEFEGEASGSVSAFRVSQTDATLTYINKQATGGTDPCFVELNPDGTHLYVCNFMSGSVCVFSISADGAIGPYSQFIQHKGSSINLKRQSGPHPHSVIFSPDARYVFVPDLGLDKIVTYRIGSNMQLLTTVANSWFATNPGAGPRHGVFDSKGRNFYLINELDCTILVLERLAEDGSFAHLQTVSSLPEGACVSHNSCADIHITPNDAYVYGSNRGHNSLIIYKVDQKSGLLSYAGCQSCEGETPRNFAIDPTGRYLLCANQDSDNIVVFEIDYDTGMLYRKSEVTIPTPVCVKPYIF